MKVIKHTYTKCFCHIKTDGRECFVCKGLAYCEVCKAAEGELLPWCPGFKLSTDTHEACYRGNVRAIRFPDKEERESYR